MRGESPPLYERPMCRHFVHMMIEERTFRVIRFRKEQAIGLVQIGGQVLQYNIPYTPTRLPIYRNPHRSIVFMNMFYKFLRGVTISNMCFIELFTCDWLLLIPAAVSSGPEKSTASHSSWGEAKPLHTLLEREKGNRFIFLPYPITLQTLPAFLHWIEQQS